MISRKPGRVKRIAKRVGVGLLTVGVAAGLAWKLHTAELKAKTAFFSGKTPNVAEWVDASRKLGISSKELNRIKGLSPQTLRAVEKKAIELGIEKDGVKRVLDTLANNKEPFSKVKKDVEDKLEELDEYQRHVKSPKEKARIERIKTIVFWASRLPEGSKRELADLCSVVDIPEKHNIDF